MVRYNAKDLMSPQRLIRSESIYCSDLFDQCSTLSLPSIFSGMLFDTTIAKTSAEDRNKTDLIIFLKIK